MTTKIYPGNDHLVQVLGAENEATLAYIESATVTAQLLTVAGGAVTGGGPVTLSNQTPGDVGGTGNDTVAKTRARAGSKSVVVTIGATNPMSLAAGDWVRFHGHEEPYVLSYAASGSAGSDVTLFLEAPLRRDVKVGEPLEAVGGVYEGTIEDTADISAGISYIVRITFSGGGLQASADIPVLAETREV